MQIPAEIVARVIHLKGQHKIKNKEQDKSSDIKQQPSFGDRELQ